MTIPEMVIALIGLVVAGLVKGVTGVGFSTTALPIIALGLGLERAMPLVLLPSIASNVAVMATADGFGAALSRFRLLFIALLPGLAAGLAALSLVDAHVAARVLGVVLLAYAAYALARPTLSLPEGAERLLNVPVGLLNGFINGLTGSQIMPVVPYGLALGLHPDAVLQLTNITFTLSSLLMLVGLAKVGFLDQTTLAMSAVGVVPALAAVALGAAARQRLAPGMFRRLVLVTLIGLAVMLIAG